MTDTLNPDTLDWQKVGQLIPAVVQDADDGRVLMLGYMNPEALSQTMETGKVTFYSRTRRSLWTKGETSGNPLDLVDITPDCDGDTLLVHARPNGPVCHTGTQTCFGDTPAPGTGFLARLQRIITERREADPDASYTARLMAEGLQRCAQKVGEEGVETALAAVAGDVEALNAEAADLVYHLLVLLARAGSDLDAVARVLRERHTDPDTGES